MESLHAHAEEAYDTHGREILRFIALKVADRQDAEDITADTFVRYWEKLKKGEHIENPRALLFTIARGLLIDHYRKKGRRKDVSLETIDELFEPEGSTAAADTRLTHARILTMVQALKERYAEVILLHYVEGHTIAQIADMLRESENTIRVRLHRALEKVREQCDHER